MGKVEMCSFRSGTPMNRFLSHTLEGRSVTGSGVRGRMGGKKELHSCIWKTTGSWPNEKREFSEDQMFGLPSPPPRSQGHSRGSKARRSCCKRQLQTSAGPEEQGLPGPGQGCQVRGFLPYLVPFPFPSPPSSLQASKSVSCGEKPTYHLRVSQNFTGR